MQHKLLFSKCLLSRTHGDKISSTICNVHFVRKTVRNFYPAREFTSIVKGNTVRSGPTHQAAASYTGNEAYLKDAEAEKHDKFKLSKSFVEKFADIKPPFGFNGLGELVYRRSYSRLRDDGRNEEWYETVERVVNGTYTMQKNWIEQHQLGWNATKAQGSAQEMYRRIFEMKFLPPGRGLWAMGSPLTEQRSLYAALNNCAFVSTASLTDEPHKPFAFLMDLAMLGVGVGFDTKGAGTLVVKGVRSDTREVFVIPDSREGWVLSVAKLIDSYFGKGPHYDFDYSAIRGAGVPIKGFGGISSGPEPLRVLHTSIREILDKHVGRNLTETAIVDIMNLIGRCVVSGNVRRTAEIAFGDPDSKEYIDLKNYDINPQRAAWGWTSNNSVFARVGMNYGPICERVIKNGEPGFAWLENMQQYSRMNGIKDLKDSRAQGGNPCLEQTLESYELCCLVETFPGKHKSMEDFMNTLKYAYLYAKTVTLGKTHWAETNRVMLRNRRIGCSISGITQFISQRGLNELKHWLTTGYDAIQDYDKQFSDWLTIPRSIKTTCIKPSGTVSLLAGATPGMHYPPSNYYIRRVRLPSTSALLKPLIAAGYNIHPAAEAPETTCVVEFPISVGEHLKKANDVSMWEQLSLAAFLQEHWADNQVSCTVTFDAVKEGPQMKDALELFQYKLKGISFLPLSNTTYKDLPYEEITESKYKQLVASLKPIVWRQETEEPTPDKFCSSDKCNIQLNV